MHSRFLHAVWTTKLLKRWRRLDPRQSHETQSASPLWWRCSTWTWNCSNPWICRSSSWSRKIPRSQVVFEPPSQPNYMCHFLESLSLTLNVICPLPTKKWKELFRYQIICIFKPRFVTSTAVALTNLCNNICYRHFEVPHDRIHHSLDAVITVINCILNGLPPARI